MLIFSLGYLHLQSCHLDTFLRSSQSPIFKLQSLLTTLLEHEAGKKATTSTTTTFCVPSRFQFSAWLPFSSPSRPTFQVLKYYLGFGNCLLSAEQEKFPKFSSCSSTFLKTCAVTAKKYLILDSMESTWSQDKLPRGHNFRRNGNDSIEWPGSSSPPYKVHNLVKSLTFPSTTSS